MFFWLQNACSSTILVKEECVCPTRKTVGASSSSTAGQSVHKQTTSPSPELENSSSAGNTSGVPLEGEGLPFQLALMETLKWCHLRFDGIGYRYGPMLAIILYGCNFGCSGMQLMWPTQSHCDTYIHNHVTSYKIMIASSCQYVLACVPASCTWVNP